MWKFFLSDKNGKALEVSPDGHLVTVASGYPTNNPQKIRVFSQMFTTTGLATGSNDLGVSGAATPVEYFIPAIGAIDRYITRISFLMGYGSSGEMYEFADSGAALTNGIKVSYFDSFRDEITIMNPKANYSFMRATGMEVPRTAWETRGFAATGDYGYFANIDIAKMLPPYGVKLDKGTAQRMVITIRDDCTDADLFNCQAFGFERVE